MKLLDPRRIGLVAAAAALATGATIAGCAEQIDGAATPNAGDLAAYKSEAASSSAAATSSRKAAARDKAIADNCNQFPITTGVGVTKYNEFVDAHDSNAPDYVSKRDAAVATLEDAATKVETGVNAAGEDLPSDLAAKFTEYVDAARALARAAKEMTYTAPVGPLNDASRRVNDARNAVRAACPT
ncbi:hypothetical protein [Nocardia paucivorans]|uniref:hypothetical protein n=1 Tax=Nocardia paucivorans TaxID=114259 RepID=UPI000309356F|nr:hypothetical protein [Nocardia paucivorans]